MGSVFGLNPVQAMPLVDMTDDDAFLEPSGSQSDRKTSLSSNTVDVINVNQLLASVRFNPVHVDFFTYLNFCAIASWGLAS